MENPKLIRERLEVAYNAALAADDDEKVFPVVWSGITVARLRKSWGGGCEIAEDFGTETRWENFGTLDVECVIALEEAFRAMFSEASENLTNIWCRSYRFSDEKTENDKYESFIDRLVARLAASDDWKAVADEITAFDGFEGDIDTLTK